MPRGKTEVPSTIERSDRHAQEIWRKAHDSAVDTYGDDGEQAHRVAFAALKHEYRKDGDHWTKKARRGPSDAQAARGPTTRKKSTDRDTVETKGGKVAGMEKSRDQLYAEAKKLDVKGRSSMKKEELAEAVQAAKH